MTAHPTPLLKLQQQLADTTPLFGERRRRRAAERLAELAREASPDALAALAQAVATGADESVREIAASALRSLPAGAACDALCRFAVEEGHEAALTIATAVGYAPSDPSLRAAFLALAGRWGELDAFDLDGHHLRAAYETAAPDLRRRLAAAAREAGRAEWVQVAVGGRQRLRLAQMTRSEWLDVLALLADPAHANEAWRLAQEAPPCWGRGLLLGIAAAAAAAALPECDRADFARLYAVAARCGAGEIPFFASINCVATLCDHEGWVTSLAVTPAGRLLASGSVDKTIKLWSLPDGECVATLCRHESSVESLAVTPDGRLLASGSLDETIKLWRLPDGECVATLRGHENAVWSLAVTADGRLLASGSGDGTVKLWSLPDGECVATLRGHESSVMSLAVTADDRLLASGSGDGAIKLWSLPDGECVETLRGHEKPVWSLAVTADGRLLASGSDDRTTRLWSLPGGECVATLRGHESSVMSLAAAAGDSLLASGSGDGAIKLWSLPGGECVETLRGHEGWVASLAVNADGHLLASGSHDSTIRLWQSPVAVPAAAPVAVLARDINRLLALRGDGCRTGRDRAWLDFMLALVERHRRFDIEVEVCDHVEVGEFDIEIGSRG